MPEGCHRGAPGCPSHSEEAIIELLMLAGAYRTVSYLVNGLQLPLEPTARRFAEFAAR